MATSTQNRRSAVEVEILSIPRQLQAVREVVTVPTCSA
jgi:hypothetical protein